MPQVSTHPPAHPDVAAIVLGAAAAGHKPDPRLTLDEWSERYGRVPAEDGPYPGRYHNDRTPYWIEVARAISPSSRTQETVVRKGAQLGFTRLIVNYLCMLIHIAACPILYISATLELLRATIDQKIDPTFRDVPEVAAKLPAPEKRTKDARVFSRKFPGGILAFATAGSAATLRARTVRVLLEDEVDAYPQDVGEEGDPVKIARARTKTFGDRRKIVYGGTPTLAETSKIDELLAHSTDERYLVPCPHCRELQELVFSPDFSDGGFEPKGRLVWDTVEGREDPRTAAYECAHCRRRISESHKRWMLGAALEHGRNGWHVSGDPNASIRGFAISSLYAWPGSQSWADIVAEYLEARDNRWDPDSDAAPDRLRAFFNTTLGISWKERNQAPPHARLHERREQYPAGIVPDCPAAILTAGVDVQADRFEYELVAWGPHDESWSVAYDVIPGGPDDPRAWQELERRLLREEVPFAAGGSAPVRMVAVDSSYASGQVYHAARVLDASRVMLVKGRDQLESPLGVPQPVEVDFRGRRLKTRQVWHPVGVSVLKSELYGFLAKDAPAKSNPDVPGYCHFPDYDEWYFKGLTAEALVAKKDRLGRKKYHWAKVRDRNEPLDCRVYARAAAIRLGVGKLDEADWDYWRRQRLQPSLLEPPRAPKIRTRED